MELVNLLKEHVTLEIVYYAFAFLVFFDTLTGVVKAWKNGRFKSRSMRDGLFASIGELLLLMLAIVAVIFIPITAVVFFPLFAWMIFKELSSIGENLIEIGVELPEFILKGLQVYTDKLNNLGMNKDNNKSSQKDAQ